MSKPIKTFLHKKNRYAPTYDDRRCEHTVNGVIERFDVECGTARCRDWFQKSFFKVFGAGVTDQEVRNFIHGTPFTQLVGEDIHTWTCLRCEPHRKRSVMIEGVLVDVGNVEVMGALEDARAEGDETGFVDGTEQLVEV